MEHHFVIGYDTDKNKWFVDFGDEGYFPEGNIYDAESETAGGYNRGWRQPKNIQEEVVDQKIRNVLNAVIDIIPVPKEEGHV